MDDCRSLEARSEESLSRSPSQVLMLLMNKILMVLMSYVLMVLMSEVLVVLISEVLTLLMNEVHICKVVNLIRLTDGPLLCLSWH